MNPRIIAVKIINEVINHKKSLTEAYQLHLQKSTEEAAFIKELCFGVLRWYRRLAWLGNKLLFKPLKAADQDLFLLIIVGLYQLMELKIPDYAAVKETVAACDGLGKPWAKKLINALLRKYQAEAVALIAKMPADVTTAHPSWLLKQFEQAWPEHAASIVEFNNSRPCFSLRVNLSKITRQNYLQKLHEVGIAADVHPLVDSAIILQEAMDVNKIPGFHDAEVSVQDASAQCAAALLQLTPDLRVLDACAAPGGKTMHILESAKSLAVTALDKDPKRLARISENLTRLQIFANLVAADASLPEQWWDKKLYDRILLDAPCTGTGVIRRHPDIKWLRQVEDIAQTRQLQLCLLQRLWPLLKPGGVLVYSTCSILPAENSDLLQQFLLETSDCEEFKIDAGWGFACAVGRQILPNENMDGFYYARLKKSVS